MYPGMPYMPGELHKCLQILDIFIHVHCVYQNLFMENEFIFLNFLFRKLSWFVYMYMILCTGRTMWNMYKLYIV